MSTPNVFGPRIVSGLVIAKPFWAKFETKRQSATWLGFGRRSFRGLIARDKEGRVRTEFGPGKKIVGIAIADPVARKLFILDPRRRTYKEFKFEPPPVAGIIPQPTDAEVREVEGVLCFRLSVPGMIEEAWISPDLQHVVAESSLDGGKRFTWRMFEIKVGDPPADLFRVPSAYRPA